MPLILFSLLIEFYGLYSTEIVQAQIPSSFNVEDRKIDMISVQGNQYCSFQTNPLAIDVKEMGLSNVKNDSPKSLSTQIAEDNFQII